MTKRPRLRRTRAPATAQRPGDMPLPWELGIAELNQNPGVVSAIKAIAEGVATGPQQVLAWSFMLERLCGRGRLSFWPGGEDGRRASDFAEGARWVGLQLERVVRMKALAVDPRGAPPPMPGEPQE